MHIAPFCLRTIDHVVIRATNAQRLVAFYVEALGCKLLWDRPDLSLTHLEAGNALIDILNVDDPLMEQVLPDSDGSRNNVDHICLRIHPFDPDAMETHFRKFGIHFAPPRERYGATGYGFPSI